ncbi:hypothetical protein, conserved [Eimeria praecox]|uniref:Uncharacterized protein n=1 Tax=Eimeria praecox TaxID=51316 RepID=U6GZI2_9EIME|nr:hypothetical protein, conserved [Eimeria praecox]
MNRTTHSEGSQRAAAHVCRRGLLPTIRLVLLLFALLAPFRYSLSAPTSDEMTGGGEMSTNLEAPLISKVNEALTTLWPQLVRKEEVVELSDAKAAELVDAALLRLRTSGETIPINLRDLLLWHLTCLFHEPEGTGSSSEGTRESPTKGSIWHVMELVACAARDTCLGINEPGFQSTVDKCAEEVAKGKTSSPLDLFFRSASMKKQSSLAAQVFSTALLVLHSTQGNRLVTPEGAGTQSALQGRAPLSPLQQAVANSVAGCSPEVITSLESHLQALGGLEAIGANPVLFASTVLENAPLLFSLNGVPPPESLALEYEALRESGTKFGLALVRGASRMISTACGKERRCGRPSNSYLSCVSKSLENVAWPALRQLLNQHVHALAYFVEKPEILPEGPHFSDALQDFTSSASKLSQTLRAAASAAHGALDLSIPSSPASIRLLDALKQFGQNAEDNLLPVGMSFLEDGELSLYGPAIHERIVSTTEETCTRAPPAGDSSAFKTFVIMQRLEGHLDQVTGNETLQRVYMGTAKKTGLSARAVESTFIRTQARHLFISIQSLLQNPSEEIQKRFSTTEGLHAYITDYLAERVGPREQEGEEAGFGATKHSGETIALAHAVLKEVYITDYLAERVGPREQEGEEAGFGAAKHSGETIALAHAVLKEVQRTFAKLIVASEAFHKAQQTAGMRVGRWLKGAFSDFRKDIHASYIIDAAHGCLQHCTGPLLADNRLKTQCTGSSGGPQPLGKCADPAQEFQKIVNKEMWGQFLPDWLTQGKAPAPCSELVELQEEDPQAWQRQVYLMVSHLDTIGCGKDHRGFDSFGRYSIKLEMIQNLYDMFASTAKKATLENFVNWLVKLREPLPQNLQTPTAVALQYAGGHPQTQVRVSKAFTMAVKGDPTYAQCKAEDTKIISELIASLGSIFYTLKAFDDFVKERRAQEEVITRQVTAPLAAKARPILNQLMITYALTGTPYPDVVIRYPTYFSTTAVASLSNSGIEAMWVLVYMQNVLGSISTNQLSGPRIIKHFVEAAIATEAWTRECLQASETAVKPYTFPATEEEALAAGVFRWLLPTFPPLPCQKPNRKVIPVVLPIPPPTLPPVPEPSKEVEPQKEPEEEPSPPPPPPPAAPETTTLPPPEQQPEPSEIAGGRVIPIPVKQISIKKKHKETDVVKTENKDAVEPEEMITVIPPKPDVAPTVDKTEDACMQVVRLYEKYIQGSAIKDVETLHEAAMKVPLFSATRQELGIQEDDRSLQKFRLALCVTCAKYIPALQLATGEEKERLKASIEKSKEACGSVYEKTLWAAEIEGGTPLASSTPNSPVTSSVQLNLQVSAIAHRLLGGIEPLLQAAEREAKAIEVCASAEVLGRFCEFYSWNSPSLGACQDFLLLSLLCAKVCSKIAAGLAEIFGSASSAGGKRLPPSTMAGGLRNWLPQQGGLRAWATAAHQKLKSDTAVAALCAALRYAEYIRQITMPGLEFDRNLSQWNLSLPSNGLPLVNALRSASNAKQTLTQELCVLTPPAQDVQRLPQRFDPAQWAALVLQIGQQGEASTPESPRSSEA